MSFLVEEEIREKIKSAFKKLPKLREVEVKPDLENVNLYRKIENARVFNLKCSIQEYLVPLLDKNGKLLRDKEGRVDYLIISIYFYNSKPYIYEEILKVAK